jgi:hypothetical protein
MVKQTLLALVIEESAGELSHPEKMPLLDLNAFPTPK